MINWYVERASSYAADIDNLILLVTIIVGFWFFVAQGALFWFLFRYSHQKEKPAGQAHRAMYVTGEEHEYARWIHWPHYAIIACDLAELLGKRS